jgi:hypothetical protein
MCRGVTCKGSSKIAHGNSKSTRWQSFHRTQPEYANLHQWTEHTYCLAYVLLKISRLMYVTVRAIWKLIKMRQIQWTLRPAASSLGPKQSNRFGYNIERWTKEPLFTALHIWYWPRLCTVPVEIRGRPGFLRKVSEHGPGRGWCANCDLALKCRRPVSVACRHLTVEQVLGCHVQAGIL